MHKFLLHIFLTLFLINVSVVSHAAEKPSEMQLKAAYLYNFAKFIKWPDSAFSDSKTSFVIGVLGDKNFAGYLLPLTTKTVNERAIVIKIYTSVDEVSDAHILYLGSSISGLHSQLEKLKSRPIVTISDDKKFVATNGMIQFVPVRGRLRFIINLANADAAGVRIDSQLLSLAIDVLGVKK